MLHKNILPSDNHPIYTWTYTDATARTAATGFVSSDVGKVAWQTDTDILYILTATTPTWVAIGAPQTVAIADITDWPAGLTATELGYVDGVTSAIQTQIDGKSSTSHDHSGVYELADATILKEADIGTTTGTVAAGDHTHSGVYEPVLTAASQAEMEAGTEAALRSMSPLRVAQAIAALGGSGGATALDDLTDVTITTPSSGQVLKYNGSTWVNGTDSTGTGGGSGVGFDAVFLLMGA